VAGGSVGRRRGTGLPAAGSAGGGAVWLSPPPLHTAVDLCLTGWTLPTRCWREEGGGGAKLEDGGGQGHPWLDGRPVQVRVAPSLPGRLDGGGQGCRPRGGFCGQWTAGGGQGHTKIDGRRASARVAPSLHGLPPVPPPSGRYWEASVAR
jgi:hypothetical protein